MTPIRRRTVRLAGTLLGGVGLVAVATASSASAADIYWAETSSSAAGWPAGRIGYAPLEGGGTVSTYQEVAARPTRVAVTGNVIAWNTSATTPYPLSVWNLAKTGTAVTAASTTEAVDFGPQAIDAATGKIYFSPRPATSGPGLVQVANLDGSGSPATVYTRATDYTVSSVLVDAANSRLYWCEFPMTGANGDTSGNVVRGSLDGSAPATVLFANEFGCNGLAIDATAGKVYWARYQTARNTDSNSLIRVGNLDGSGAASTLYNEGSMSSSGMALDPATGRLYWANQPTSPFNPGQGSVRVGHISGTPAAADLYGGLNNPNAVSLVGSGTAPAPTPTPAPGPAPVTKVVTKVGAVRTTPAKGVRGNARQVSLALKFDEGGRYTFFVQRPNGKRQPLLAGSRLGSRTVTTGTSAVVIPKATDNATIGLRLLLGGRSVPKGTVLRVVYTQPAGGIVKQNISLG